MTRPSVELYFTYRYWIVARHAPITEFTDSDVEILEKLKKQISEKIHEINAYNMEKAALCDDPKKTVPRWSICGRCSVISPTPDGCGHMCGLTLRAVEEAELNSTLTECLAIQKINPLGGSSGITGGVDL